MGRGTRFPKEPITKGGCLMSKIGSYVLDRMEELETDKLEDIYGRD